MKNDILSKTTCFGFHEKFKIECQKKQCRQWIACERDMNCTILSARKGPKTLQQIGDIFDLTRMRVCQLEKSIVKKIKQRTKQM
jgi:DNA-directed RNA polymerase sigma subunit (sigma70/sigma32)